MDGYIRISLTWSLTTNAASAAHLKIATIKENEKIGDEDEVDSEIDDWILNIE